MARNPHGDFVIEFDDEIQALQIRHLVENELAQLKEIRERHNPPKEPGIYERDLNRIFEILVQASQND